MNNNDTIVINIGNTYVKSHIDILIKELKDVVEFENFDLAYIEDISTPKLRIGFDVGFEPEYLSKMVDYFTTKLQGDLYVTPLFDKKFIPMKGDVFIDHAIDEKRKLGGYQTRRK